MYILTDGMLWLYEEREVEGGSGEGTSLTYYSTCGRI